MDRPSSTPNAGVSVPAGPVNSIVTRLLTTPLKS
jgi:hypothetical protein